MCAGRNGQGDLFFELAVVKRLMKQWRGFVDERSRKIGAAAGWLILRAVLAVLTVNSPLAAESVSLQALVTPSTAIVKDDRPVSFAVYGFIEFKSLAELFPYIESQTQR
jgi:hypothetical protein